MQYLGGKVRLAKYIASEIVQHIPLGGTYVEPFCGACAVAIKVREYRPDVKIICNDLHPYLIALLRGVADGSFDPPETLSEDEYKYIRANKDENPALAGFAGFGCSFSGRWFQGYARSEGQNFADEARRSLKQSSYHSIQFYNLDYRALEIPEGAVVYCDPPYKDTKGYSGVPLFDYSAFLTWIKALALSHDVFMSEYAENVNAGARVVWSKTYAGVLRTGDQKKRPVRTDVLVKV